MKKLILALLLIAPSYLSAQSVYSQEQILDFYGQPAAPANPPTNYGRLYFDTTSATMKCLTSTGGNCLSSGGGSGTVTSVTFTGDGVILSSTPSTAVTTSGTLTASLVNAGAGTLLNNATSSSGAPAYTGTPVLGVDNSSAGTLTLANGSSNAHTILASGATTTNTIKGFTVVPTTGDLVSCTSASTTCTLTDAGVVAATVNVWSSLTAPSGNLALSNGTNTSIFSGTAATNQFFAFKNTTAAVVGTSQGSPVVSLCGRAFHGSADVEDCMTLKELPGNGNDAAIAFTIGHTGTSTGTVSLTAPILILPNGVSSAPAVSFASSSNTGIGSDGSTGFNIWSANIKAVSVTANALGLVQNNVMLQFGLSTDVGLSREGAGILDLGNGTASNKTGLLLSGNKVFVTTDFTSANSASLQAITGLTYALGSTAINVSFHCALAYSQATAVSGDQFGVGVITTAPTNVNVDGTVYTSTGAASSVTTATLNGLASTTPTSVVTFQPAVNATIYNAFLDGTVETAGGGAATFNIYVLNGTAANVIVVKRGSYCSIF